MNKRIHNKRFGRPVPHPWQGLVGLPPGTTIRRRSFYSSIDLSTPTLRRAYRKGHQSTVEHRRVEAAIRRQYKRAWRRECRAVRWRRSGGAIWVEFPHGVPKGWSGTITQVFDAETSPHGHMHREEDWVPKP